MKTLQLIVVLLVISTAVQAQQDSASSLPADTNTYRIVKTDGGEIIGRILKKDARELFVRTSDGREIYIPQHTIEKLVLTNGKDFNANGSYIGDDKFATRYFITTNGLPIKKGEHYVQWNLYGPDFQFSVADNVGVGVMAAWFGTPIIANAKYSFKLGEKTQAAVGGLFGTGSWSAPDFGGALPFATISHGSRSKNIAVSGGYGAVWVDGDVQGRAITSVAGMIKVSQKLSLVFDSFILMKGKTTYETFEYTEWNPNTGEFDLEVSETIANEKPVLAIFIPGIRWHQAEGKALQFGFTGVYTDHNLLPIPIPMVQWYRSL